jgi:flavin reductase (DIM6/NTAB) family NADH-FMN oxidoreductase RutF
MHIDPRQQSKLENYKILIGSVLPRPIAFVTSINLQGIVNAAPFSFFTVVATDPPLLSITCSRKPGGKMKDTARNIQEQKEFVIHVVNGENVHLVNDTAIEFPEEISEVEEVGFDLLPSEIVQVPRISQTKIQMECRLHHMLQLGGTEGFPNSDLIIGEVVQFHIDDSLYNEGRINTKALDPIGRLAGSTYTKLGETFAIPRYSYEEWLERKK